MAQDDKRISSGDKLLAIINNPMKKLFVLTFLAIAIASFGPIMASAHAQTVTSDQATLQQQLELMKAKLQLLQLQQMQAGQNQASVPAVQDNTPAATGATVQLQAQPVAQTQANLNISSDDAAALNAALSALATTLVSLQSAIQGNPQFLAQNGPVIAQSLSGIEGSLTAVLTSMRNGPAGNAAFETYTQTLAQRQTAGENAAPLVAVNPQKTAKPQGGSQTPNQGSLLPSVDSITQPANAENNQTAAVTASALGGKNRLPAIIVGIILLAMVAILVWGRGGEELATAKTGGGRNTPKSTPVVPVPPSISFVSNHATAPNTATPASSSPLANAMNQQRKTAI